MKILYAALLPHMRPPQTAGELIERAGVQTAGPGLADAELLARFFERLALEIGGADELPGVRRQLVDERAKHLLQLVVEQAFEGNRCLIVGDLRPLLGVLARLTEQEDHTELAAHIAEPGSIARVSRSRACISRVGPQHIAA